jgi:hypothetical protein
MNICVTILFLRTFKYPIAQEDAIIGLLIQERKGIISRHNFSSMEAQYHP